MTEPENHAPRPATSPPSELETIGVYPRLSDAEEAGLSVLAAGHTYWIYPSESGYALTVMRQYAPLLRREVAIAEFKNRFWPPVSVELPTKQASKFPTIVAVLAIIGVFIAQQYYPRLTDIGANDAHLVLAQGEFWRLLTATTLHANTAHLAGNILGLSLFSYFSCRYMGSGLAWILAIIAAGFSNLANSYLHADEAFRSLGASTVVFAALGLITGFPLGIWLRLREAFRYRDWLIPFFGGCILFAWMGGGDYPTDIPGHLWSFAYGTLFAIAVGWSGCHAKIAPRLQRGLSALALALPTTAWLLALF